MQQTFSTKRRHLLTGAGGGGSRRISAPARVRRRSVEDRLDPAADRTVCFDRAADRGGLPALRRAQRRLPSAGRKVELTRQRRHRARPGDDQAHRAGDDRAGPCAHARGIRADAARARRRAGRDRGQGADDRHGRGDVDHHDALAVHRPLGLHAAAGHRADGRVGGEEQASSSVFTLVTDYGPGLDAEKTFIKRFTDGGGTVRRIAAHAAAEPGLTRRSCSASRTPSRRRCSCSCRPGEGTAFMKEFAERGLAAGGHQADRTGDVTDDDVLDAIGAPALGVDHAHSTIRRRTSRRRTRRSSKPSRRRTSGMRPNFMAVGGYDGMHLIYEASKKTGGDIDGEKAGRGDEGHDVDEPARTDVDRSGDARRDPDVYIRKVEMRDGHYWNVEFDKIDDVKDPAAPEPRDARRTSRDRQPDRRAVRRRRVRQPAVPHQHRPVGDDGSDEFRQSGARRVRDARRLRLRRADDAAGVPFLATLPMAFVAAALAGAVLERTLYRRLYRAQPSRPGAVHASGWCSCRWPAATYVFGSSAAAGAAARALCSGQVICSAIDFGVYRLFLIAVVIARDARADLADRAHALRRRDTRLGRQPAGGRRARHQRRSRVQPHLRAGLGTGRAGRRRWASTCSGSTRRFRSSTWSTSCSSSRVGGAGTIKGPLIAALLLGVFDVAGKYYVPQIGSFVIYA